MREIKFEYIVIGNCGNVIKEIFPLHDIQRGYAQKWLTVNSVRGDIHKRQFTGLTDVNGVEIYEGDVVRGSWINCDDEEVLVCEVSIIKGCIAPFYECVGGSSGTLYYTQLNACGFEIIGNKYQNPELLENQNEQ